MMNFLLDYALTAPDTVCYRIEAETAGNVTAIWEDIDEECFIVKIFSLQISLEWEKDRLESLVEPYLFRD